MFGRSHEYLGLRCVSESLWVSQVCLRAFETVSIGLHYVSALVSLTAPAGPLPPPCVCGALGLSCSHPGPRPLLGASPLHRMSSLSRFSPHPRSHGFLLKPVDTESRAALRETPSPPLACVIRDDYKKASTVASCWRPPRHTHTVLSNTCVEAVWGWWWVLE